MKIFPAIDLLGGRAVRLLKGEYGTAKTYSDSPAEVALGFKKAGASDLHVVDLDGAKSGKTENGTLVREIIAASGLRTEIGGGIRDLSRVEYYLSAGAERVIIGTAAVKNPTFLKEAVREFGAHVAVGVDLKGGLVAVDGWTETEAITGEDFIRRLAGEGVETVIVTDVSRDGALSGTNMQLYERLIKMNMGVKIIASGGVTELKEVAKLKELGVYGAILGKALYEGRLDLTACLKAAREGTDAC